MPKADSVNIPTVIQETASKKIHRPISKAGVHRQPARTMR
jgi:hypothetical protein